jgi:hypothetical protein
MTVLGTNVLQGLYQEYLTTELTYTKDVAAGLGLLPNESTVKIQGLLFPCVVHSASFQSAKFLLRLKPEQWKVIQFGSKIATLTLVLLDSRRGKKELYQFNGSLQVLQKHTTPEGDFVFLAAVQFSHRPHEVFLQSHGSYLNLKKEAHQRQSDRILLTPENMGILELASLNTTVIIDKIERKCLLREVSYGGARVILTGVGQLLNDKPFDLTFPHLVLGNLAITGKITRAENMESHRGLAHVALSYSPGEVPVNYLGTLQKAFKLGLGNDKKPQMTTGPDKSGLFSRIDPKTLRPVRPSSRRY